VCADLAREDASPNRARWRAGSSASRPGPKWRKQFREEGFYERFPAKGEVERVRRVHRDLAKAAGIDAARNS
jgi:hypothetical protein